MLQARRAGARDTIRAGFVLPAPAQSTVENLATLKRELAPLDEQESGLRAEVFREQSALGAFEMPLALEAHETLGHRSGPCDGGRRGADRIARTARRGNAIAGMIHEIDRPVGQVKIGVHVLQFMGADDAGFQGVHVVVERHSGHARRMSQTSQTLFPTALNKVASRHQATHPQGFEEAFFDPPCVRVFRRLHGSHAPLSAANGEMAQRSSQDETTDWVLQTWRRRARARVADASEPAHPLLSPR